jgi:hypothetical protein
MVSTQRFTSRSDDLAARAAAIAAFAMIGNHAAGRSVRDALFLSEFDASFLPRMFVASAIVALGAMLLLTRVIARQGPGRLVQIGFFSSSILLLVLWRVAVSSPSAAAIALYFLLAVTGSVLISWFWAMVTERFDPRTAKRKIGPIVAASSCGGIAGGILAERAGATLPMSAIFPMLAVLHAVAAIFVGRIGFHRDVAAHEAQSPLEGQDALTTVLREPYLRSLAALVGGVAVSAVFLDYVFKARAQATFPEGAELLRFFALFYMATSIVTLAAQTFFTRRLLQMWGLSNTAASLPAATAAASLLAVFAPGLGAIGIARGMETTLRSSVFRSSYELFYTPIATRLKRTAKTLVDVGFDRAGEGVGAIAIHGVLIAAAPIAEPFLLITAIAISIGCLLLAPRLHRGYVAALERSLLARDSALDPETIEDETTRSVFLRTLASREMPTITPSGIRPTPAGAPAQQMSIPDPLVAKILELRSGDSLRVRRVLASREIDSPLIPHLIRLLAWDEVSSDAARALASGLDKWTGQLIDSLIDPEEEFSIRRRIPRILARSDSPRAVWGLLRGLRDTRFEVRFRCADALAKVAARNRAGVEPQEILEVLELEMSQNRLAKAGERLLDREDDVRPGSSNAPLRYVFTLLGLAYPRAQLQAALDCLESGDARLRGTALEYLDTLLQSRGRDALLRFIESSAQRAAVAAPPPELDSLQRSHETIRLSLSEIRRTAAGTLPPSKRADHPDHS